MVLLFGKKGLSHILLLLNYINTSLWRLPIFFCLKYHGKPETKLYTVTNISRTHGLKSQVNEFCYYIASVHQLAPFFCYAPLTQQHTVSSERPFNTSRARSTQRILPIIQFKGIRPAVTNHNTQNNVLWDVKICIYGMFNP